MAELHASLGFTIAIAVLAVDECGYIFIDGVIEQDDMVGIVQQLIAEKRGLA